MMKWFEGSINQAVATSKSRKAIFVVFVEGKTEMSTQIAQVIDSAEVSSRLEKEDFVSIKLESGSEAYRFFVQIYQLVPIPSLFFIGENGKPLEIIADNLSVSELASKIDAVLSKAGKQSSTSLIDAEQKAAASSSTQNPDTELSVPETKDTKENSGTEVAAATEETPKDEVIKSTEAPSTSTPDVPSATTESNEIPKSSETEDNTEKGKDNTTELTQEQKVERARQLMEAQRKQRLEEEEKKERERELERCRVSRDVQKFREKQQDLQMRQAQEERIREKAADAAAREKVRQQIAQDKLERKQRELALQEQMQQQQQRSQPKPQTREPTDVTIARIQFRLPSGNPHMGQFQPMSTLRSLRTYVVENIELPFRQFTLSTSFPRRELTSEDDDKTLLDLQLVPTAVILILPLKHSNVSTTVTSSQDVGFLSRFMWTLFAPLVGMYNYIMGYFGAAQRNPEQQDNTDENESTNPDSTVPPRLQNVPPSSGLRRRYLGNPGGTTIRAEGNIHRLHTNGDDSDENNTWNGNSTQQM